MKLAFWRKEKIPEDPFDEKELAKFGLKKVSKEQVDQIKSDVKEGFTGDHIEEIQALNQLGAYAEIGKRIRVRKSEPFNRWLPPKVMVAWFDRNYTVLHVREMTWTSDGLVSDSWWGRAADVLGPNARPIVISVKGKTSTGFIIDGDKGLGINIERDNTRPINIKTDQGVITKTLATLGSTSEMVFAILNSKKISEQFGSPITTRTLLITSAVVGIMAFLMGHSWQ